MIQEQARGWTIRSLMKSAIDYLQRKGLNEARLTVELLLSHALQMQRIQLYTNFDKPLSTTEVDAFRTIFERRLNREPVQYIIGSVNFMGLQLMVNPHVLIPRPETETVLEQLILESEKRKKNLSILDVGTGSGNIAIAAAKYMKNSSITAVDISEEALAVARENARLHGVEQQIQFFRMDILKPDDRILSSQFDVIVSNPPYIAESDWNALQPEILNFEPKIALSDYHDGLTFYRSLVKLSEHILDEQGTLLVEIGSDQKKQVEDIFRSGGFEVTVINDLQNVPRVIRGVSQGDERTLPFSKN